MKCNVHALMLVVLVSGCAQNQMAPSQGSQPTTKNFDACGLSVRFSGQPDAVPEGMLSFWTDEFGIRPVGPNWIYVSSTKGPPRMEIATCVCPPEPKLSIVKVGLVANGKVVEGIGRASEPVVIELDDGVKALQKMSEGDATSNCFAVQVFATKGTPEETRSAATSFFSSLAALPKVPQKTAIFRTDGSAAQKKEMLEQSQTGHSAVDRLKLLDQLLKEKLITQHEYNTRRSAILESL